MKRKDKKTILAGIIGSIIVFISVMLVNYITEHNLFSLTLFFMSIGAGIIMAIVYRLLKLYDTRGRGY